MVLYTSVAKKACVEQVIEKSRFIAHVAPAASKAEAEAFIAGIKAQYKDATHNVPAYIIGRKQELIWASDDGEPQGTSGAPIAQMLVKEGLTNLCVVVTRYFGGTKLGTGGLVRAYTSSAKLALQAAGLHQVKNMVLINFQMPYNLLPLLQNHEKTEAFTIEKIGYADQLGIEVSCEEESEKAFLDMIQGLGCGNIAISNRQLVER